jgi:hypothetical protein
MALFLAELLHGFIIDRIAAGQEKDNGCHQDKSCHDSKIYTVHKYFLPLFDFLCCFAETKDILIPESQLFINTFIHFLFIFLAQDFPSP